MVVSNLWSQADAWRKQLREQLPSTLFHTLVFSSDLGINKPAPGIYEYALQQVGTDRTSVLMVGDDYLRDVVTPRSLGIKALLLSPDDLPGSVSSIERLAQLLCEDN